MIVFYCTVLVVAFITALPPPAAAATADGILLKDDGHYSSSSHSFAAAAAAAGGVFVQDDGSTNDFTSHRRVTNKYSKKTKNIVVPREAPPSVCTWRDFVGFSKYLNCKSVETEIQIECGDADADADADADDTTRMCTYTERPVHYKDAAAAAAGCVVRGSFDPNMHITNDYATGFCHLDFFSLFDSYGADAYPSGLFGMKAEIHNRNTRNHHNNNNDNSGILLRFSRTRGADYMTTTHGKRLLCIVVAFLQEILDGF